MNNSANTTDLNSPADGEIDQLLNGYGAAWRERLDPPPAASSLLIDLDRSSRRPTWYRRSLTLGVAAAVVVAALVLGTFIVTKRTGNDGANPPIAGSTSAVASTASASLLVPNFIGLTQNQAIAELQDQGLKIGTIQEISSNEVDNGKVVKQIPAAAALVKAGTPVDLFLGSGVHVVALPNVIGQNQTDAESALQKLNLKVIVMTKVSSDSQKGNVISQSPVSGAEVPAGSTVNLVVGSGSNYTTVPKGLTNLPYDKAAKELTAAHLVPAKVTEASPAPLNQVLGLTDQKSNTIKEGDAIAWGTIVTLRVSDNSLMTMPTIVGDDLDVAFTALKAAGWAGSKATGIEQGPTIAVTNQSQSGQVLKQTPAARQVVPKTSTVTVQLGAAAGGS